MNSPRVSPFTTPKPHHPRAEKRGSGFIVRSTIQIDEWMTEWLMAKRLMTDKRHLMHLCVCEWLKFEGVTEPTRRHATPAHWHRTNPIPATNRFEVSASEQGPKRIPPESGVSEPPIGSLNETPPAPAHSCRTNPIDGVSDFPSLTCEQYPERIPRFRHTRQARNPIDRRLSDPSITPRDLPRRTNPISTRTRFQQTSYESVFARVGSRRAETRPHRRLGGIRSTGRRHIHSFKRANDSSHIDRVIAPNQERVSVRTFRNRETNAPTVRTGVSGALVDAARRRLCCKDAVRGLKRLFQPALRPAWITPLGTLPALRTSEESHPCSC